MRLVAALLVWAIGSSSVAADERSGQRPQHRIRHWNRRLHDLLAAADPSTAPSWVANETLASARPSRGPSRRRDHTWTAAASYDDVVFRELWVPEGWRGDPGRRRSHHRHRGGGSRTTTATHGHRRKDKVVGRPQSGRGGRRRPKTPAANHPPRGSGSGRGRGRGGAATTVFVVRVTRGLRGYNSRLFGQWSRWSPCSDKCTTHRTRWCKRPPLCGADIVREEAYCYVENSSCQRWIQRHIWRHVPDSDSSQQESEENALDDDNNLEGDSKDIWQCGVPGGNKGSATWSLTRIVGGRPSSKGRWPWQVAILNRFKEVFCGGTLIAPRWILTAAHCLRRRMYARLGEHDISQHEGTEIELKVEAAIPHPSYDDETVDSDLALLRLPFAIRPSRYQGLACLPEQGQILPPVGAKCTVIGWGKAQAHDPFGTDLLHEVQVPIARLELCRRVYHEYSITDNMFCAGYLNGRRDSCAGDSGGPLLCRSRGRWTIFGITSFGEGCGKKRRFGIYTRLSNYVDWIHDVIGNGK